MLDQTQRSKFSLTGRSEAIYPEDVQTFANIESPLKIPGNNSNLRNNVNSKMPRSLRNQTEPKRKAIRESLRNFHNKKIQGNNEQNSHREASYETDHNHSETERSFYQLKR